MANDESPINAEAIWQSLPLSSKLQIMYEHYLKDISDMNQVMGEGYLTAMNFNTWNIKRKEKLPEEK